MSKFFLVLSEQVELTEKQAKEVFNSYLNHYVDYHFKGCTPPSTPEEFANYEASSTDRWTAPLAALRLQRALRDAS